MYDTDDLTLCSKEFDCSTIWLLTVVYFGYLERLYPGLQAGKNSRNCMKKCKKLHAIVVQRFTCVIWPMEPVNHKPRLLKKARFPVEAVVV